MFSWLFGKKVDPTVRKFCRAAKVYYRANDGILIATEHADTGVSDGPGEPMTRLPFNAPDIEIGDWVVRCLKASTGGHEPPQLEALTSAFFQLARVKGWSQLEKRWEYLRVHEDPSDKMTHIVPYERCRGGGYEATDDQHQVPGELDAQQIGTCLRKLVDSYLENG